jgi:hypothetical protein
MLDLRFTAFDPGRVKTFFLPQKLHETRGDPRRHDREHIFAVSSLELTRAQPRATLSDLNGHAAQQQDALTPGSPPGAA